MSRFQRLMRWAFGCCYFPSCECRLDVGQMKCMPAIDPSCDTCDYTDVVAGQPCSKHRKPHD